MRQCSVSWHALGLTKQDDTLFWNTWSKQAWLQPMHVLMSLGLDSRAFFTKCGSAKKGRAMLTMSAAPAAKAASQSSAVLNRLVVTNGTWTLPINFWVTN